MLLWMGRFKMELMSYSQFTVRCTALCSCMFALAAAAAPLPPHPAEPAGLTWQVRGSWHTEGNQTQIQTGDPIRQGLLLSTGEGESNASITVLLPDGQRILYECFTPEDCARGFRVPKLYRTPEPFAIETLARIRAALEHE